MRSENFGTEEYIVSQQDFVRVSMGHSILNDFNDRLISGDVVLIVPKPLVKTAHTLDTRYKIALEKYWTMFLALAFSGAYIPSRQLLPGHANKQLAGTL